MLFNYSAPSNPGHNGPEEEFYEGESWCELSHLKQIILENMPVTQHLHFSLFRDATEHLIATAPLEGNANHHQTAFGGSLSMLATIAGWAMMHLVLSERGFDASIVIQESCISYCAPVCDDLMLRCEWPSEEERAYFFDTLERWGKARLSLCCTTTGAETPAVVFDGSYVALAP
jgi:thioesterase domain-containing protein